MSNLPHLLLQGTATEADYVYAGGGGSGTFDRPKRNQPVHGKTIRAELKEIGPAVKKRRAEDIEAHPELVEWKADGVVLTFRSDPNHELSLERLDREGAKIELISVDVVDGVQIAKVFIPDGKITDFLRLVDAYAASTVLTYHTALEDEPKIVALADSANGIKLRKPVRRKKIDGVERVVVKFLVPENKVAAFKAKAAALATLFLEARLHEQLIDSISSVRLAIVEDFWQDRNPFPAASEQIWWEVWLRGTRTNAAERHRKFTEVAELVGIPQVSEVYVAFPERVVVHALATPAQLSAIDVLAMIGELRKGKELATHYVELSAKDQVAFVEDAAKRLVLQGKDPPCVLIVDAGVNRPHPLIKPALAEVDQHAAKKEWGVSDHDPRQHGTGMAGNALYGCLTEIMKTTDKIKLRHILESAKIMPPKGNNLPPDYGRRMQEGIALAHIQAPKRNRVVCMAVTTDEHLDGGIPSLWSGAVDDVCSGGYDGKQRLMVVSAGNMRNEICKDDYVYHDWNRTKGGVEDPGQAWNALTVGAFTEKVNITYKDLKGWSPVAESGDLCPTSRTSLAWPAKVQEGWPIKPDIVMEGGNYARKDKAPMSCDDLSLLTTFVGPTGRLLTTTRDTSPATALAARMAATLWSHHPKFWPETIRALIVHSARWKPAMTKRFPGDKKSVILQCLRCYGYGVPDLERALHSAKNAVTMIYEGQLQPFRLENGEVKTNHMHIHELPWPVRVLEDLGGEVVTMHVTLSYFVEPSPGNVGWGVNHRYASHGLRFDVIRPTEGLHGFKQRISRAFWDSPTVRPKNEKETRNWAVGEDGRALGSLHSDWWTGTAATLARSGNIVVYPVTGWWRERPNQHKYNMSARYCLLVSISSGKKTLDLYTPITNIGTVQTEIVE